MTDIGFGVCGAGFWAQFQIAAWFELSGVECRAICDPDVNKAKLLADRFKIRAVYSDAKEMLARESLSFIDIISSPASHEQLVRLGAEQRVSVICQKPMSENLDACKKMVQICQDRKVWFAIHENWRWQSTLRAVKKLIDSNAIGSVFRCRLDFTTGFDVFANQPTLRDKEQFIIADLGCHLVDYARSLFGEAQSIYCRTRKTSTGIRGEDVATISLWMNEERTMVDIYLAYAGTPLEDECFPQTRLMAEGTLGSIELLSGYRIRITTQEGAREEIATPPSYAWADPRYGIVHSSMVACNQHFLDCIQKKLPAETDGQDNLRTMQLVFAAYESAFKNSTITDLL